MTTSNLSTSSYFIATDVKGSDSLFTIIIQNGDFFGILFRNMIITSEEQYKQKIVEFLKENKPFIINAKIEKPLKNYEVIKDSILEKLLLVDRNKVLKMYFENGFLKTREIDFPQEKRIIYYLYKAGIPCWRDDISGHILIKDTIINTKCK